MTLQFSGKALLYNCNNPTYVGVMAVAILMFHGITAGLIRDFRRPESNLMNSIVIILNFVNVAMIKNPTGVGFCFYFSRWNVR